MKFYAPIVMLAAVLFIQSLPAAGVECPDRFVAAEFPANLPPLGADFCPTSANIGSGDRLIQQDFMVKGIDRQTFTDGYRARLVELGWKEPKVAAMGLVTSLQTTHPDGMKLQLVSNNLNLMQLQNPSATSPAVLNVKVILQKVP